MGNDQALIFAETTRSTGWEPSHKQSYTAEDLRSEYERILFTEQGARMVREIETREDNQRK